jgi:hypothetical protein
VILPDHEDSVEDGSSVTTLVLKTEDGSSVTMTVLKDERGLQALPVADAMPALV